MTELPEPLALWKRNWQRVQHLLAQAHCWQQAAVLGLHLRVGLWLHGQAAGSDGTGLWAHQAQEPAVAEQVFPWPAQVAQCPPLSHWPSAEALWQRIVLLRPLHPGPKLQAQVYLLLQLFRQAGAPVDELSWLRWHLSLDQALATWLERDEESPGDDETLPWLFAPAAPHMAQSLLFPNDFVSHLPPWPGWEQRLATAFERWDQGDHGGLVVRELLAAWADAQRRNRSHWNQEQQKQFARVHQLLDGTRPWELLPRASAVLETETWPQRCEELHRELFAPGCSPASLAHRAWQLLQALDDAELVLYAGRRLARINAQLAQRIQQQRLAVLQRPGVLLAAWPWAQEFCQTMDSQLARRDYELTQTTTKFQVLADHLAAAHWRLSFFEPPGEKAISVPPPAPACSPEEESHRQGSNRQMP